MNRPLAAGMIVLVRHGPSSFVPAGRHDRDGVERCREAYDLAGIQPGSHPPPHLRQLVANAAHVVSSDLPRALESCRRLAADRKSTSSPLLRELDLPIPNVNARLPLMAWEALIHLTWGYAIVTGRDLAPSQRVQARQAAEWLIAFVPQGGVVVAVTHGAIRRAIGGELRALGWRRERVHGGYRPWSDWSFAQAGTGTSR